MTDPAAGGAPERRAIVVGESGEGLRVVAYRGVESALIAFDLAPDKTDKLAGFAIDRTDPKGSTEPLLNRISFDKPLTKEGGPPARHWTDSHLAPFQYFRWVDIPPDPVAGEYSYTVTPRYFVEDNPDDTQPPMCDGRSATVTLPLVFDDFDHFKLGFTRGYLSSQAYVDRFHDDAGNPLDFRWRPLTLKKPTDQFQAQYEWLGFTGRKLLFDFLDECIADTTCTVDMLAFDFDDTDMLHKLEALGPRLRALFDADDAHTRTDALELTAQQALSGTAGDGHIKAVKFPRLAHWKVLIKKDATGNATKVLAGSANFSVRGLYSQANNIFVFDDAEVAGLYEEAFNQAFDHPPDEFNDAPIAADWHDVSGDGRGIPSASFCFSPHKDGETSLAKVSTAIARASSSVLYALMQWGGGSADKALDALPGRDKIFSSGVVDQSHAAVVYSPSHPNGTAVSFDFLHGEVPWPFHAEFGRDAPGAKDEDVGKIIHDKFVVVDFNGEDPQAFFGSSNLAKGGEELNGDSLLACSDPLVVTAFAIEAIRNIDHYQFRCARQDATPAKPLGLKHGKWWNDWYAPGHQRCRDRELFANPVMR
jgi:hypothetical protein